MARRCANGGTGSRTASPKSKEFRAIATHCDKTAAGFRALINLVAGVIAARTIRANQEHRSTGPGPELASVQGGADSDFNRFYVPARIHSSIERTFYDLAQEFPAHPAEFLVSPSFQLYPRPIPIKRIHSRFASESPFDCGTVAQFISSVLALKPVPRLSINR